MDKTDQIQAPLNRRQRRARQRKEATAARKQRIRERIERDRRLVRA